MIYLMRHGETSFNIEGRLLGQSDIPLCQSGIDSVYITALAMKELKVNDIFSSNYQRAIQTADILASVTGAKMSIHTNLNERHLGIMDGQIKNSIRWRGFVSQLGEKYFIPPNGESVDNCISRFSLFMKGVVNSSFGNKIIVSHGGIISLYMIYILNADAKSSFLDNCAFHVLNENPDGELEVIKLNATKL